MVALRSLPRLAAAGVLAAMLSTAPGLDAQELSHSSSRPNAVASDELKDPTTARVLGIIPGAGHLYAGEPRRAALVAGTFVGLFAIGTLAVFGDCAADWNESDCGSSAFVDVIVPVAIIGTWGFSIWDAGRAAHRTNARRRMPGRIDLRPGLSVQPQRRAMGVGVGMTFR